MARELRIGDVTFFVEDEGAARRWAVGLGCRTGLPDWAAELAWCQTHSK